MDLYNYSERFTILIGIKDEKILLAPALTPLSK